MRSWKSYHSAHVVIANLTVSVTVYRAKLLKCHHRVLLITEVSHSKREGPIVWNSQQLPKDFDLSLTISGPLSQCEKMMEHNMHKIIKEI